MFNLNSYIYIYLLCSTYSHSYLKKKHYWNVTTVTLLVPLIYLQHPKINFKLLTPCLLRMPTEIYRINTTHTNVGLNYTNKCDFTYVKLYCICSGPGSVVGMRLPTDWTVRGSNPGGARFSAPVQPGPEAHPAS